MQFREMLGKRQLEVVEMYARDGLSIPEVAVRLNVSSSTVSTHLTRAKYRLQARNSHHLVALYWQWRAAGDREVESWGKA